MKTLLLSALFATLSFAAVAQTIELPRVNVPDGLASGEFAEGTVTRLNAAEVAEFLPWAQNARNSLTRAMNQARSLPLRERLPHIERAVKNVVGRSGSRQYQMLMRFSLNRGLLLVDELERNIDMNLIGAQENALDILQRSINIALSFYESDLTFQQRAQSGGNVVVIPHAQFGAAFMQGMYAGVVNVLDATAQYRLLYKLIEMVNWDLSRDGEAPRYAEAIVEAYEMTVDLPQQPEGSDKANLRLIRRLNSLKIINLRAANTASRAENTNEADGVTPMDYAGPGNTTSAEVNTRYFYDANYSRVREVRVRISGGSILATDGTTVSASYVQNLVSSWNGISVGDVFYDANYSKVRTAQHIVENGTVVATDRAVVSSSYVRRVVNSNNGVRTGDNFYDANYSKVRRAKHITQDGVVVAYDGAVVSSSYVVYLVATHSTGVRVGGQFYDQNYSRLRTAAYITSSGVIIATDGAVVSPSYVAAVQ